MGRHTYAGFCTSPLTSLRIVVLALTITLISSPFFVKIAFGSASSTNVKILRDSGSTGSYNSSLKDVLDKKSYHRRHRHGLVASSYVRAAMERRQLQRQKPNTESARPEFSLNVRKLASGTGCLTNPAVCQTVPGMTTANNATTCCSGTGACTDTQFDNFNCGACSNACNIGYQCCSGVCVATAVDPRNCGRCANICKGGYCFLGFCNY